MTQARQPSLYIPHGGGPCFFMDDPRGIWTGMETFLRDLPTLLPARPTAILIVSGHWETEGFAFTAAARPGLLFDYYGFPPHTYQLTYPAPGDPALAAKAAGLLAATGMTTSLDATRGLDHGVFVPLKVAFPDADIPVVEMSTDLRLDPAEHLAAGRALAPLRDEGVLIIGAGMSFHNMRGYGRPASTEPSRQFDSWLAAAATAEAGSRSDALLRWADAPAGRFSHPREEHLLPLMVAAGASDAAGERVYGELVMETAISGFRFA
ncbi:DODA-type extradiol aromatic ring-opening family dioxygenase [Sphingomonas abietis]|uniref:Class III extradiol ring-cleavage dioxygenase n=1 Tax=Sphingomonas abietis TaxID=3012344 RepID=A0ABY7NME1_9SPHN|nr:class III extradiol ring-cleavage dioxygenase [Sphingomonas abietis]WBO22145.1 class III extradiol ring-cleavage dioxygenase [Sphingomonas abietis]